MTKNNNTNRAVIVCTRYNDKTWNEYQRWKEINGDLYEQTYKTPLKCIYGSPRENAQRKIEPNQRMIIIEMHNDKNKIMGIGLINNRTASEVYRKPKLCNKDNTTRVPDLPTQPPNTKIKYNIFSEQNYNRYIYIGNELYITREEIERSSSTSEPNLERSERSERPERPERSEEKTILEEITELETLLFKGSRHSKRGSGLTKIPKWIIDGGNTKIIEKYIGIKTQPQHGDAKLMEKS
jgi:hypothetical protein